MRVYVFLLGAAIGCAPDQGNSPPTAMRREAIDEVAESSPLPSLLDASAVVIGSGAEAVTCTTDLAEKPSPGPPLDMAPYNSPKQTGMHAEVVTELGSISDAPMPAPSADLLAKQALYLAEWQKTAPSWKTGEEEPRREDLKRKIMGE